MRLLNESTGKKYPGRCKSTNLCSYCAKLAAVENSEVLALDALHGAAPTLWVVLTTPSTCRDPKAFYKSREVLIRAFRRRWPQAEYAALLEFTTGYGPKSGGKRRPHWNVLLKGIPAEATAEVRDLIEKVWCPRVGGKIEAQHVGEIGEAGGLMRYIALHFQKESQAPPKGWSGQRFMKSKGYLWLATPEAREVAKRSLRLKREMWRLERCVEEQLGPEMVEQLMPELDAQARKQAASKEAESWRLVQVAPSGGGGDEKREAREAFDRAGQKRRRRSRPRKPERPPASARPPVAGRTAGRTDARTRERPRAGRPPARPPTPAG